jgi:hypothetical protein
VLCLRATVLDIVFPLFAAASAPAVPGQTDMHSADAGADGGDVMKDDGKGGNGIDAQGQQMMAL